MLVMKDDIIEVINKNLHKIDNKISVFFLILLTLLFFYYIK